MCDAIVARLKWEVYQVMVKRQGSGLTRIPVNRLFPKGEPEQVPEIYEVYLKCKDYGGWRAGGYSEQPHLMMMAFDFCAAAESQLNSEITSLQEIDGMK